jgi:hypothetical protein
LHPPGHIRMWRPAIVKSSHSDLTMASRHMRMWTGGCKYSWSSWWGVPLKACWAFNERWNNEFCYSVASCWFQLKHCQYICCSVVGLNNNRHLTISCIELPYGFHTPFEMSIVILKIRDYFQDLAVHWRIDMHLERRVWDAWIAFILLWVETKDGMFWTH